MEKRFFNKNKRRRLHATLYLIAWNTYIKTAILNRWIQEIQRTRPIPGGGKIKYCTQISSRPPSFVFFSNKEVIIIIYVIFYFII